MNADCSLFRARLERRLGGGNAPELGALAWHEHLGACAECSALLASEQALDALLASLPDPHLPPALARRVLARLASARTAEAALDDLLELSRPVPVPPDLAARVLAKLDRAPAQAGGKTEDERIRDLRPTVAAAPSRAGSSGTSRSATAVGRRKLLRLSALAAVLLLFAFAAGVWLARAGFLSARTGESAPAGELVQRSELELPPEELLGSLDVLESWDFLRGENLDAALLSLEPIDEVLLELRSSERAEPPPSQG